MAKPSTHVNSDEMRERGYLPEDLVEGCGVVRDVTNDSVVSSDDVGLPDGRLADKLREE
jgi:predicted homoserine dehydrogenase-like protein